MPFSPLNRPRASLDAPAIFSLSSGNRMILFVYVANTPLCINVIVNLEEEIILLLLIERGIVG
jgi:hypothetical protein